jgi:NADP-dependent 3-hydroxy acid dehydrogenase YdfG
MNILITGASKGIGLAIVKAFAHEEGSQHNFGLCSRHLNELILAEAGLKKQFPLHRYYSRAVDVSNAEQVAAFVSGYEKEFGAIDILVNNAGFGKFAALRQFTLSDFRSVIDTNLRGVFLVTKAALPKMREKKSGTIIAIGSLAGKNGFKGGAAYCASKFGVRGLMQCLFLEVRKDNIRVVSILPGTVDTAFYDEIQSPSKARMDKALRAEDVAVVVYSAVNLPLRATISEIELRPTNP